MTTDAYTPAQRETQVTLATTAPRTFQQWLTIERALYGLIILVATAIRFFHLTKQPLNLAEAANSWTPWLVASGQSLPMDAAPDSPLLYSLFTTLFWLFGGSDFVVRAVPAICGVGMVWLLWYWRDWLGRVAALIAAMLIAIDPWLVAYSRLADSTAITLFLGMLTLTAFLRLMAFKDSALIAEEEDPDKREQPAFSEAGIDATDDEIVDTTAEESVDTTVLEADDSDNKDAAPIVPEEKGKRTVEQDRMQDRRDQGHDASPSDPWQQCAAIAFGLLLVSGPQMWSWLVVLGLFAFLVMPISVGRTITSRPTLWLLSGGAAIVGATGWLAHPEGLGALSTSLTVWLQGWTAGTDPYPLGWLWIHFLADIPLLILFGLIGFGLMRRDTERTDAQAHHFFTRWLLWGLLLVLLPGRSPLVLPMVGLPLLFFAANGLSRFWQSVQLGVAWRENGILALVLAILFLSAVFWFAGFSNSVTFDDSLAGTLALILILMVLLIFAYALWIDGRQAWLVASSGIGAVLFLWTVSSMWALNHHFEPKSPDGFFQTHTDPDVRNLVDAVTMLSAQRHGDAGELPLQVQMAGTPDPVLGWYLREMRNLIWVLAPGAGVGPAGNESPPVVITLSGEADTAGLTTAYLGSSYTLRERWLPTTLIGTEVAVASNPDAQFFSRLNERLNALWSARIRNLWRWIVYHKSTSVPSTDNVVLWVASPNEATQ